MAPMYYRNAAAAIVCFDITDERRVVRAAYIVLLASSFNTMKDWVEELKTNVAEKNLVCGTTRFVRRETRRRLRRRRAHHPPAPSRRPRAGDGDRTARGPRANGDPATAIYSAPDGGRRATWFGAPRARGASKLRFRGRRGRSSDAPFRSPIRLMTLTERRVVFVLVGRRARRRGGRRCSRSRATRATSAKRCSSSL